jgi:hypothetical protein
VQRSTDSVNNRANCAAASARGIDAAAGDDACVRIWTPSRLQVRRAAGGSALIERNGVSVPTKYPILKNTARAASSSAAGTPASSNASSDGETCTALGVAAQKIGWTPQRSFSTTNCSPFHCQRANT